jgi:signal transduction histidine kinase
MMLSLKNSTLLLLLLLILAGAEISDIIYRSDVKYSIKTASLQKKLIKSTRKGEECLATIMENRADLSLLTEVMEKHSSSDRHILLYYRNDSLALWTDNSFDAPAVLPDYLTEATLVNFECRKMIVSHLVDSTDTFICLVPVWREYIIENDIVRTGFISSYNMPEKALLGHNPDVGYPVYNGRGYYLFSVNYDDDDNFLTWFFLIPLALWITVILVMVLLLNRLSAVLAERSYGALAPIIIMLVTLALYTFVILTGHPGLITGLDLFSPYRFTLGKVIPSPGHLLLIMLIFYYVCWSFYRWVPLKSTESTGYIKSLALLVVRLLPGPFLLLLYTRVQTLLITESNICFDLHRILDVDHFTVTALISSSLLMLILVTYLVKILKTVQKSRIGIMLPALLISSLVVSVLFSTPRAIGWYPLLFWITVVLMVWLFRNISATILNASVVFAILSAVYASLLISEMSRQRELEKLKVMAVNYSTDNDLYAEFLLQESWPDLRSDTLLASMMARPWFTERDADDIYDYLDRTYFNGYWGNYNRIYTLCNHDSELIIEGETGESPECFDFFSSRMAESGSPVIDTSMVFIENNSGRAYYLGEAYFNDSIGGVNGLFVELISRIEYKQSGYPELLVDNRYSLKLVLQDYQMAKYVNDTLAMQTGTGFFDVLAPTAGDGVKEFVIPGRNGNELVVFRRGNGVTIVIARPSITFLDKVVIFTYLFVGFFLLFLPGMMLIRFGSKKGGGRILFRHKMQYAFVIVLLWTMSAVGGVVIYLSTEQYREKHLENIREKLNSVNIELEHKLGEEEEIDYSWSAPGYLSLDELLIKFSNVFFTDINLYDTDGNLLASSRREIFDKNLTGSRMNYFAWSSLSVEGRQQYTHMERIGDLQFLSAYSSFVNNRNKVLAYLNLPYFNMQSRLTKEISNLVVAIINFTLILLVISMSLAVFISGRITSPLRMLQQGLASVRLEKESEPLKYGGSDEIGELVDQYNKMLGELHDSALKLARSEREVAWREMAKQIAHEIKNPLTPMKLSVQQLHKSWTDGADDFNENLARFTENMIEQINNLSSIATEFSNFARMPKANPVMTDILTSVRNSAHLFSGIRNIRIEIKTGDLKEVIVFADREQINGMLTNLIRNSVQAVSPRRQGLITISVKVEEGKVLLTIEDNGSGIPDGMKDKLFTPNFTTKSSGMGLGLSIVKRIVETANGSVWFDSEEGIGTRFFIEYPVVSFK